MTFSYTMNPTVKVIDKVRFLIGDTVQEKHLVEDEEITWALTENANNVNSACSTLCAAIAARFARDSDVRVSTYAVDRSTVYEKYSKLAQSFSRKTVSTAHFICPSISVTDKATNEADTDATKPFFTRDLMENEGAGTPEDADELT